MSALKLEYTAHVNENGSLRIINRKRFDEEIKRFAGKDIEITVQKKRKNRSYEQSKYYWGVVVALVRERFEELGNSVSKEETHDYLKHEFNYREFVNEKTSEIIRIPKSTADLTTTEFMDYIAKIQVFASTILDIYIPSPNEQLTIG